MRDPAKESLTQFSEFFYVIYCASKDLRRGLFDAQAEISNLARGLIVRDVSFTTTE